MTLLELMIAMSIMVMVVGTLGVLSKGVQQGYEYTEGHSTATHHARVVLERIARTVREATANDQFPGVLVLAEQVGTLRFPDALVVWRPDGDPADPSGLPLMNELVVFCPDPTLPNRLLEITLPTDTRVVAPVEDEAWWQAAIQAIRTSDAGERVALTDLVRICPLSGATESLWRGAVRFELRLRPAAQEWQDYRDGDIDWEDLPWVQGIYGSHTGLRQVWLRTELQLSPGEESVASNPAGQRAVPFFGSAALYYELHK